MANQSAEFYCSSVEASDGGVYFVGAEVTPCPEEPSAINEATVNITVTDGRRAWTAEGLTEQSLGTSIPNRMRHALEALVEYRDPTEEYLVRCTPHSDGAQLLVEVEWDNRRHGKDIVYRVHFELDAAPDTAEAVRWVMGGTLAACTALKSEAASLEAACATFQKAAEDDNKTLEEYASRQEELDGDVAFKGAALLAAKQEHLAELLRLVDAQTEQGT